MRANALVFCVLLIALFIPTGLQEVSAAPATHLTGYVLTDNGTAFPGVMVTAVNAINETESYYANSTSTGNYTIDLPAGTYNISASYTDFSANTSYSNVVIFSDLGNINFTMSEILGTVSGHVTNGTAPIIGAMVVLTGAKGNFTGITSIPLGQFTITNVQPGQYVAYATKDGYNTNTLLEVVTVTRNQTTFLNFVLTEQPSRLSGKVVANNAPLSDVKVTLSSDIRTYNNWTNADGNYAFDNVPAGIYKISFTKSGYITYSDSVTLAPLKPNSYDATLSRDTLPGNGGFIPGYDLAHSLMIVGMILAIVTLLAALFVRYRVGNKPELLNKEEEEQEKET